MQPRDLAKAEDRACLILDLLKSDDTRLVSGLRFTAKISSETDQLVDDLQALALAMAWAQILIRWIAGDAAGQPETITDAHFVNAILSLDPHRKAKP